MFFLPIRSGGAQLPALRGRGASVHPERRGPLRHRHGNQRPAGGQRSIRRGRDGDGDGHVERGGQRGRHAARPTPYRSPPPETAFAIWGPGRPQYRGRLLQRQRHHQHGVHRHVGGPGRRTLRQGRRLSRIADHGDLQCDGGPGPGGQHHNQRGDRQTGHPGTRTLSGPGDRSAGRGNDDHRNAGLQRPRRRRRLRPRGDRGSDFHLQPAGGGGHHRGNAVGAGPAGRYHSEGRSVPEGQRCRSAGLRLHPRRRGRGAQLRAG